MNPPSMHAPEHTRLRASAYRGILRGLLIPVLCVAAGMSLGALGADALPWPELQRQYLKASRAEHDARLRGWEQAASWDFDQGGLPEGFTVFDGEWKVEDGKLVAFAGEPDRNRTIKIADCRWSAFRLEFDATLQPEPGGDPTRVCDVGLRFNADPATGAFTDGYAVITAQYGNQATVFYRLNIPAARTEWSPLEPGKRHRVVLEVVKPHVRFWVDGRVVLDAWERRGTSAADHGDFLPMDPARVLALSTYDTRMEIDNITISTPVQ